MTSNIENLENIIDNLTSTIEDLRSELGNCEEELLDSRTVIEDYEATIKNLDADLKDSNKLVDFYKGTVDDVLLSFLTDKKFDEAEAILDSIWGYNKDEVRRIVDNFLTTYFTYFYVKNIPAIAFLLGYIKITDWQINNIKLFWEDNTRINRFKFYIRIFG